MFGLFNKTTCTHAAQDTILHLLAPISTETPPYGQLPKTVLSDAYVIGFLQSATFAAMKKAKGCHLHARDARQHFLNALKGISPECAKRLPRLLSRWNEPQDTQHEDLLMGRLEGQSYAQAWQEDNETAQHSIASNFHLLIRTRHLDTGNAAYYSGHPATPETVTP